MRVCVLLLCVCFLSLRTGEASESYLVAAPLSFRVDAVETVLLQLFGFSEEELVYVFLKTSMAPGYRVLAQDVVKLNVQNHHQATATVRLLPSQLDQETKDVVLHVQSPHINKHITVPVSRNNGFLFLQTDKPLYTPNQRVKVRAFSLNQELRPANRSVFLTFKDPDHITVDIVEMIDRDNGLPSMQNPFRIPINPKLGLWTVTASYSDHFSTLAKTNFEVKEYVLPSFIITIEPQANYISYNSFNHFNFKVSARYLHGAPVSGAEVLLRYGYISGNSPPMIVPNSVRREQLSSSGEAMVTVNMEKVLSQHNGYNDLNGLKGKYLYIATLVTERGGGISQEYEFAAVKFLKSPFSLNLISTPLFIKPGLPYDIKVLVKDHLDQPMINVPVRLVEGRLFRVGRDSQEVSCTPESSITQSDGLASFSCGISSEAVKIELTIQTADPTLPALSQARHFLTAVAYQSPNQRYLYISLEDFHLSVGNIAHFKVYSNTPSFITVKTISYMVVSRGRVLTFNTKNNPTDNYNLHTLSFKLTADMFPSVRLLVYYLVFSEGTSELVADSVWLDVRDTCVNGLKTEISVVERRYRPDERLTLDIRTNQDGLVALSAVDTGLLHLRPNYRDPVTMVVQGIEKSDLGCGGGGGKDGADVFRLAGLTFITNANAQASSSIQSCQALVRPKRALNEEHVSNKDLRVKRALSEADKESIAAFYGLKKNCCKRGLEFIPKSVSCEQFALQSYSNMPRCKHAFTECCLFLQKILDQGPMGRYAIRRKRSLTPEEREAKAASYGRAKVCCENGMRYVPKSMSCQRFALQQYWDKPICERAFRECCLFIQESLDPDLVLGRNDLGPDFDMVPVLVRSSFPESWLWDVRPVRSGQLSVSEKLPHSLTTWKIQAVGMFGTGVCAAKPLQVSVTLLLSVDVPLPYQVVRGEQVELQGSVYNQRKDGVTYCVTLRVGPAICLHQSQPEADGHQSTTCNYRFLPAESSGMVEFTLMGFQPGEHELTFTLTTKEGPGDILKKKLRVVPEGIRQVVNSGGTLDPRGVYGSEKRTVYLRNRLPANMVPNTSVQKMLSISGEVLGDVLTVILSPDGLQELVNLPKGSAEEELCRLRPLLQVHRYLETTGSWGLLGDNVQRSAAEVKQKIKEGLVGISSFKNEDFGYSMWKKQNSSTWLTALVLQTLWSANQLVNVDHQSLFDSVSWLIRNAQRPDGSFMELSYFKANRAMNEDMNPVEQSVYLTSFVLIALKRISSIQDPILQLSVHDRSRTSAEDYIKLHVSGVKSVYVRAVVAFAMNLNNPNNVASRELFKILEKLAMEKGQPAELRYWQESNVLAQWVNPDESSGQTVETTAYVLLTTLLLGRVSYAKPILLWLTQDQHYGQGFFNTEDLVLTLEAMTEYSMVISKADLQQKISIRIGRLAERKLVSLSRGRPVATPIQLKTVYYETAPSTQSLCNFDLTIEAIGADVQNRRVLRAPHLVACAKYRPPPNEVSTEASLTIMTIQLPTGVDASLEDLRQFRDSDDPLISYYEMKGNTVIIQTERVSSRVFLCVGFRIRTSFRVGGATQSLFTVREQQDRGSLCTKRFSYEQTKLQRLCVDEQCQCLTAACATFRRKVDASLTAENRTAETCRSHIRYAYKVTVKSSEAEGDFWTFTATVDQVLKINDPTLAAVAGNSEVDLVKKTTCSEVDIHNGRQYLIMGASSLEVKGQRGPRYRLALDSDAVLEEMPLNCSSIQCKDYISQLDEFSTEQLISGC